jgi:glycerol-3-phosphate acyltransferase PlsX
MDEKPTQAVRAKPNSSLVVACRAVGEGKADAVVSAGNTGAMLAACLLELRRIPGVRRPAIAVTIPARRGPSVLLDSGANADARAEDLVQFAHMGAVFAEEILAVAEPEIRLLSIGAEPEKGSQIVLEAHRLLAATDLNFAGNTEGRDLLNGAADVVVTDGFTGNVALKVTEGTIQSLLEGLRGDRNAREARGPADQAGRTQTARAARPGCLRRRVPAGPQRTGRDRPRKLLSPRHQERRQPRRPRRGEGRRRQAD